MSGGGAPQGPPSSPAAAGGAEPVRPIGDINDWFRKLCQSPSGVLYEDNYLQVAVHLCSVQCWLCRLLKLIVLIARRVCNSAVLNQCTEAAGEPAEGCTNHALLS